ncbi:hypothetical protein Bbelb_081620 [Branchiostoma belcheri]|nr:hypothetical protein Bbelb_081620 [Branchiostoma belcheri]
MEARYTEEPSGTKHEDLGLVCGPWLQRMAPDVPTPRHLLMGDKKQVDGRVEESDREYEDVDPHGESIFEMSSLSTKQCDEDVAGGNNVNSRPGELCHLDNQKKHVDGVEDESEREYEDVDLEHGGVNVIPGPGPLEAVPDERPPRHPDTTDDVVYPGEEHDKEPSSDTSCTADDNNRQEDRDARGCRHNFRDGAREMWNKRKSSPRFWLALCGGLLVIIASAVALAILAPGETMAHDSKNQEGMVIGGNQKKSATPSLMTSDQTSSSTVVNSPSTFYSPHSPLESGSTLPTTTMEFLSSSARQCQSGWSEYDNHCYKLMKHRARWTQAQALCGQLGANLASSTNKEENNFIKGLIAHETVVESFAALHEIGSDASNMYAPFCGVGWRSGISFDCQPGDLSSIPSRTRDMSGHAPGVVSLGKALYTTFLTPPRCEWVPNFAGKRWEWADGSPLVYRNWAKGKPVPRATGENCGALYFRKAHYTPLLGPPFSALEQADLRNSGNTRTFAVYQDSATGVRLRYYIDRESSNGKNTHSCINTGMPADGV